MLLHHGRARPGTQPLSAPCTATGASAHLDVVGSPDLLNAVEVERGLAAEDGWRVCRRTGCHGSRMTHPRWSVDPGLGVRIDAAMETDQFSATPSNADGFRGSFVPRDGLGEQK